MDNMTPEQELELLKQRADQMGITYRKTIGPEALKKKIEDRLNGTPETPETPDDTDAVAVEEKPLTKKQIENQIREKMKADKMKLVRCQIYNLNPAKRDLQGEIITVVNRYLGTVRKFIPFGEQTDNGYHIPQILFDDLKSRKFQQLRRVGKGDKARIEPRMVPEYSLTVLPQLTKKELEDLALKQAAAERLSDD